MSKRQRGSIPPFTRVEHDTKQQSAYRQIRDAMMTGGFRPGQRVSIRAVAGAMGISAMPVREAMWRLEAQGALVLLPERAFAVPGLNKGALRELRDVRLALEGLATERAAENLEPGELDRISDIREQMDDAARAEEHRAYLNLNQAFHFAIYAGAKSPLLTDMIESLWLRIGPYLNLIFDDKGHRKRSSDDHRKAEEALLERDGEAARRAIESDISGGLEDLFSRLPETAPDPGGGGEWTGGDSA
jgi:DNA-binding GntR family transcriptional regulator